MKDFSRILIALSMFVSGIVLVPVMGLPREGFNWQRYAGVYTPAALNINHASGQPGSIFTFSGSNFTPETVVSVSANGVLLGQVGVDEEGQLVFLIDSTGADIGTYFIEAAGAEMGLAQLDLQEDAPLRLQEGEGAIFTLMPDSGVNLIRLPLISRESN